jgi:hypothetical protein
MLYNDDNSPYFKIAHKLKEHGTVLIRQAKRELYPDKEAGKLPKEVGKSPKEIGKSPSNTPNSSPKNLDHAKMEEIDVILNKNDDRIDLTERISELMDAQDKVQGIKQGMARNKRLKLIRY